MTLDCPRTKSTIHIPNELIKPNTQLIAMNEGKDIWIRKQVAKSGNPLEAAFGPVVDKWCYIDQENILRLM